MTVVKPGDFDDDRVKALLSRHLESMHANPPPGHVFALDWSGQDLLGFGALKELDPRTGESVRRESVPRSEVDGYLLAVPPGQDGGTD